MLCSFLDSCEPMLPECSAVAQVEDSRLESTNAVRFMCLATATGQQFTPVEIIPDARQ
uniref:Uncharacterized protein n=1 Tax=Arundo donax TaxID=35708 RepID=A0A0A8Y9N6_ARUDO